MNFTPEQLTKAKSTKSVDELLALAKENGMELTEEEAAKYFADLHQESKLSDDELANVSGGCGGGEEPPARPEPKYHAGQKFQVYAHVDGLRDYINILTDGNWFDGQYYYSVCYDSDSIAIVYSEQKLDEIIVK